MFENIETEILGQNWNWEWFAGKGLYWAITCWSERGISFILYIVYCYNK